MKGLCGPLTDARRPGQCGIRMNIFGVEFGGSPIAAPSGLFVGNDNPINMHDPDRHPRERQGPGQTSGGAAMWRSGEKRLYGGL